jgi:DNA-binding beta-propeller fold protein YncE
MGATNGSAVIPYSSRFSPLCYFINTYSSLGPQSKPTMPLNRQPLPETEVKKIKEWIDAGAPDLNGNVMWSEPNRRKAYVVNQGCDVVTVIDAVSLLPARYIEVGTRPGAPDTPHHLRVSPDGKYWYVVFINNNIMQKYRCSDDSYVGAIPLSPFAAGTSADPNDDAQDWNTFVISDDGKKAWCVSWTANGKVAAVDLENMKLLHYLPGFSYPHGITVNPANDQLYITAQTGNYVSALDTSFAGSPVEISLQNGVTPSGFPSLDIHDVVFSPDGGHFLATCVGTNEVRVFDLGTNLVSDIIPTATYPQEIVYSQFAHAYFVSCTKDTSHLSGSYGAVTRIMEDDFSTAVLPCGYQPHGIAVDDRRGILYVASRNILSACPLPHLTNVCGGRNGFLNFINLGNFTLMDQRYELSADPYFVFVRP